MKNQWHFKEDRLKKFLSRNFLGECGSGSDCFHPVDENNCNIQIESSLGTGHRYDFFKRKLDMHIHLLNCSFFFFFSVECTLSAENLQHSRIEVTSTPDVSS